MKTIKFIVFAIAIMALTFGMSCECGEEPNYSNSSSSSTDAEPEMEVYKHQNELEWEFTQNGFTLKRLYRSYHVEYIDNPNTVDSRSYLNFLVFERAGMEYLIVQNEYDNTQNIINITKDSLICAQLVSKKGITTPTESYNENWFNSN